MSTRLFLVRHGEGVWNAEQRLQGQGDPLLSAYGQYQACALAEVFSTRPLAAVYCSQLARARETALCIAAPHRLCPRVIAAAGEVNLGAWQGQSPADMSVGTRESYRAWLANPSAVQPPGGETLEEACSRVAPTADALVGEHRGATVVLVTHSIIGRVLLCHLLGAGLELVPRLKLKTASISVVRLHEGRAVLEGLGDVSHLRAQRTRSQGTARLTSVGAQS
jgi:broad specificity phosphatase PhoE